MSQLIRREIQFTTPIVFAVEADFDSECRPVRVDWRPAQGLTEAEQAEIFRACAYAMAIFRASHHGFAVERNLGLIKGLEGFELEHAISRAVFQLWAELIRTSTVEILRRGAA